MAKAPERQSIREEFTSRAFDVSRVRAAFMTTARFIEEQHDHGKSIQGLMNAFEGLDLANLLGGRIAVTGAAKTIKEITTAQKRADKDAEDWAFYLNLIQDGQVGYYIAGEIFDNKSNWEIFQVVAEIEAATGDSFENYAKSILGEDNVPERLEDESDAEYQRRVLKTIAVEILDPHTGQIKPQYADDPVANIIRDHKVYKKTVQKVQQADADYSKGDKEAAFKKIDEASKNTAGATTVIVETQHEEIAERGGDGYNKNRDKEINKTTQKDSDDGFVGFASTSTKSEIKVEAPAGKAFKTAVVDTTEQEQNSPEIKPNDFILKS